MRIVLIFLFLAVTAVVCGNARRSMSSARRAPIAANATPAASFPPANPAAVVSAFAGRYNVPAGALYGIWSKESGRLAHGWRNNWPLAGDSAGGRCLERYGYDKCLRRWRALVGICAQNRRDGSRVCDPYQVRGSHALAVGPMQILPDNIVRPRGGDHAWSEYAADGDGDGVIDPHSLPDSVAMAAIMLRRYYDKSGDWPRAVNRYYGSRRAGYYEGTAAKRGVFDHWRAWCVSSDRCDAPVVRLALN